MVTLIAGEKRLTCYAIVDSGADHCVFPRSFLPQLGLDALSGPSDVMSGAGGPAGTHFFNITMAVQGIATFPLYAGFTDGLDRLGLGLLGQAGFFDRFHVHFKRSQGFFEIEIL